MYLSVPIIILVMIIIMFLIARLNAILYSIENEIEYKGFFESVLWPLMVSGGRHILFNPLPIFTFESKDPKIRRIYVKRNYLVISLWSLFLLGFWVASILDKSN